MSRNVRDVTSHPGSQCLLGKLKKIGALHENKGLIRSTEGVNFRLVLNIDLHLTESTRKSSPSSPFLRPLNLHFFHPLEPPSAKDEILMNGSANPNSIATAWL